MAKCMSNLKASLWWKTTKMISALAFLMTCKIIFLSECCSIVSIRRSSLRTSQFVLLASRTKHGSKLEQGMIKSTVMWQRKTYNLSLKLRGSICLLSIFVQMNINFWHQFIYTGYVA
ncbi:uncharacterized protein [Triticum aestivum]|uniref:uncharacterized protein isoform X2 n=1 Tax=Triticum aestivum TaxID=4565 RepID=UPI001D007394|nr:uncharacterized protein LOC123178675 isoform X2 [Triticum aestivum]